MDWALFWLATTLFFIAVMNWVCFFVDRKRLVQSSHEMEDIVEAKLKEIEDMQIELDYIRADIEHLELNRKGGRKCEP